MSVPILDGIRDVADRYDAYIVDVWGVLYDGGDSAFPGVVDCLERLKARGSRIVVLSNSPRRREIVQARLDSIKIDGHLYDHLVTSGEETHRHLLTRPDAWYRRLGSRAIDTGPARFSGLVDGTAFTLTTEIEGADLVLNTGPNTLDDKVEDYEAMMQAAARRGLPMICANPDLQVVMDGRLTVCAGGLAQRYAELGGDIRYHGKPHAEIYERCFELLDGVEPKRIAAIGDGLLTDIPGACKAGIDSLLVVAGLPSGELGIPSGARPDPGALNRLCESYREQPAAALTTLAW
ncbi:MAG: TIGR01459 family HAD-type hydrolase [Alphaproteobacteria bacterium]|nr:TIGR01459 family HAD-type hydrolase [Alphaproteobacteria bacterium]